MHEAKKKSYIFRREYDWGKVFYLGVGVLAYGGLWATGAMGEMIAKHDLPNGTFHSDIDFGDVPLLLAAIMGGGLGVCISSNNSTLERATQFFISAVSALAFTPFAASRILEYYPHWSRGETELLAGCFIGLVAPSVLKYIYERAPRILERWVDNKLGKGCPAEKKEIEDECERRK